MPPPAMSNATRAGVLTDAKATGGTLDATKMILIKTNPGIPNPNGDMTQFVEADFSGYAAVAAIVLSAPFIGQDGRTYLSAPSHTFIQASGSPTVYNDVWGIVYTDAAKAEYRGCQIYDAPVTLTVVGQGFTVDPLIPYGA